MFNNRKIFFQLIVPTFLIVNFYPAFGQGDNTVTIEEWAIIIGVIIAAVTSGLGLVYSYKENKRAHDERQLSLVQGFSGQLTSLKDKERNLKTKKDCEIYALNYVDLLDQIAYLQRQDKVPKSIGKYFENEFSYGLTMVDWLRKHNQIENYQITNGNKNNEEIKYDSIGQWISDKERINTEVNNKFPAKDLLELCKKQSIPPFDEKELPDAMKHYEDLPDEDVERILDLVKGYGEKLTELTKQESKLRDKLDCDLYSVAYLDLLDAIAFLYRQYIIPQKIAEYFENNFCYALTLNNWLIEHKSADKEKLPICLKIKKDGKYIQQYIADMEIGEWLMLDEWVEKNVPNIKLPIDENEKNLVKEKNFATNWIKNNLTAEWVAKYLRERIIEDMPEKNQKDIPEDSLKTAAGNWIEKNIRNLAEDLVIGSQYTWTDLLMWAKEKNITPFPKDQLPPIMEDDAILESLEKGKNISKKDDDKL